MADEPKPSGSSPKHDDWTNHTFGADPRAYIREKLVGAARRVRAFDDAHHHVLTRAGGALQAVGGAAEAVVGVGMTGVGGVASGTGVGAAPGVPAMVAGGALAINGADNTQAGLRTLVTGVSHHTAIAEGVGTLSRHAGASEATAGRMTSAVDLTQGLAGGLGIAAVGRSRAIVKGAGELAHAGAETAPAATAAA